VFVLLPLAADFRWLRERADSAWYPTARLFRQKSFDQWDEVIVAVKDALALAIQKFTAAGGTHGV
jgi:hypothetical protein